VIDAQQLTCELSPGGRAGLTVRRGELTPRAELICALAGCIAEKRALGRDLQVDFMQARSYRDRIGGYDLFEPGQGDTEAQQRALWGAIALDDFRDVQPIFPVLRDDGAEISRALRTLAEYLAWVQHASGSIRQYPFESAQRSRCAEAVQVWLG
jgi:hypothetical protein